MTEHPGFGVMLAWLLDHRELSGRELADRAGLTDNEVRAVLAGEAPSEVLLQRIAPAVGFHAVDLFILAGLEVPDDMAPLDAAAERWAPHIVMDALHLPVPQRRELRQLIHALPREERISVFAPKRLAPLADPGGWVIRMLQYRNLGWTGMGKLLGVVTPTYLSASTYGAIGFGRKELTPREGYTESLDHEVREYGVRAFLVEPAYTRTGFEANSAKPDTPLQVYADQRHVFDRLMAEVIKDGDAPAIVAEAMVTAATDAKPRLRYAAGPMAGRARLLRFVPACAFDRQIRKMNKLAD
ncbi:hypothetical protein [Streptomyces sp. NPDC005859]|uniref:hypothetical protein n=1 Tax=Streptomyces sp. NPDC005859 TaxID=3157170 RepID=UPI0033F066B1